MTITVTQEDIRYGRHCDPDCCPVGRALSRAGIPHLGIVDGEVLVPDGHHHATCLALPRKVRNWMQEFDCKQVVEPISFELDLPTRRAVPARASRSRALATA